MRPARTIGRLAAGVLGISTVAAAWPDFFPHLDSLVARQDDDGEATTATKTADADTATITDSTSQIELNTATINTDDSTATGTATSNSTTTQETFPADSPAGSVVMMTPVTTTMILYKIGDFVTMEWNYTNLLADPTAVDVLAIDSSASQTHTLTQNMTFEVPAHYTWDTENYQDENVGDGGLRVASYTLVIYDSDGSPTDTGDPGYLAPYSQLQFGLYTPQAYTPLSEWDCVVCNSAPATLAGSAAAFAVTLAFGAGVAVAVL